MKPKQLAFEVESLFSLPEIYLKIKKTIDHPASTVDDVAGLVINDPNISARILKIANSSFFGFASEIESIPRAINIMGMSQLHDLVLTISATKAFKGINSRLINMKDFWRHSIYCAVIAKLLAKKCTNVDSERLFVSGVFHNIGHLAIFYRLPAQAEKILEIAKEEQIPLGALEKLKFGFDYADVGGELLKLLELPSCYVQAVQNHTQIKVEDEYAADAAIIHIANIMVLQEESKKTGFKAPDFDPLSFKLCALSEEDLAPLMSEAKDEMEEILKLLMA